MKRYVLYGIRKPDGKGGHLYKRPPFVQGWTADIDEAHAISNREGVRDWAAELRRDGDKTARMFRIEVSEARRPASRGAKT
jgi:hypothetical protein